MQINVLEYLESSAFKYPDKPAFEDETATVTYSQLVSRAKKMGSAIARRVPPKSPIAVYAEKSVDTVSAFFACVYAGCFYMLLSPEHPKDRLAAINLTLDNPYIIAKSDKACELKEVAENEKLLCFEELAAAEEDTRLLNARRDAHKDTDPLYAMFTSGSTGTPKGIVVGHRSVIEFIDIFAQKFGFTEKDVIGNQAPFDFDVSVKDIYTTIKTGATMQIIPRQKFSFPTHLLDFLCERKITSLIWAVSALCIIPVFKAFTYKVPQTVNKILFSGEVMPIKHLNEWKKYLPSARYVNLYGPTEITCNCTYYEVDREFLPGEAMPIGKAFKNETVFLLSEDNKIVDKPGEKGEICVSGSCLALGYYNNKAETSRVFVQNPLNDKYNELIYKTGDLAYFGEDELLYFASRKDFQIKHMGHRIELSEIELALSKVEGVDMCCCLFHKEKSRIYAFYKGEASKDTIIAALKTKLPAYMLPNRLVQKDSLTLNANGKIDRKKLMEEL